MGRKIYCCTCGAIKEGANLNESQCRKCKSERQKLARIKKRLAEGKKLERTPYCENCIDKQKNGISIKGRCNKCVTLANKLRRHQQRKEQGLPEIAVRDVNFCHVCKIPKINGRCVPCRQRMAKERKAKKREALGKKPWGTGRPIECGKCGNVKEFKDRYLCVSCERIYHQEHYSKNIAPFSTRKVKPENCKCGNPRAPYSVYCTKCLADRMAEYRRFKNKDKPVKFVLTEDEKKIKRNARAMVNSAIRRGFLAVKTCEVCGIDENIEAHHDDYMKPLDVRWLCKKHHQEHHRTVQKKDNKS